MKRTGFMLFFAAVILLLAGSISAQAQVDTLYGTGRWMTAAKVTTITRKEARVKQQVGSMYEEPMKIPVTMLDSIRLADGFILRFHNGVLDRSNLMQAPWFEATFTNVKAEGIVPLNPEEIRQYYGPWNYELVYRPYRIQMVTGIAKTTVGLAVGHYVFGKYLKWYNSLWPERYMDNRFQLIDSYHVIGEVTPVPAAAVAFLGGMAVSGIVDCSVSAIGQRRLNKYGDQLATPSASSAKAMFWGGVALSTAGLTAMALSYGQLDAHRHWESRILLPDGDPDGSKAVLPPSPIPGWVPYALFGGGIALNLGFSAIQLGQTRLAAIRRLDGTVYGAHWHLGPTRSGYGLAASF